MSSVVIAIPHAATSLPVEVREDYLPHVTPQFLRSMSDVDTDIIYTLPGVRSVRYDYTRFLADPNRGEQQENEGGVVPTTDFAEEGIYKASCEPDGEEIWRRILRYHRPYHARVRAEVADPRTLFFIDAHSMSGTAPVRSPDFGRARPDAVLSNRGDFFGLEVSGNEVASDPNKGGGPLTCPPDLTQQLSERLSHWLTALPVPHPRQGRAPTGEVRINDPFPGGHGVRTHAHPREGIPGLQLELNQALWCEEDTFERIPGRIEWIRKVMSHWLEELVDLRAAWDGDLTDTILQLRPIRAV
ncbi:MAG: N-formylglutamate amidohydrolase [Deltaproteobacteria bacterium]|nr:N-formylglutamate amidohydrolase [Deltaproteobacteria bacterium]